MALQSVIAKRSHLEQYTVSDFLDWDRDGRLNLNPDFQRKGVWKPDANSYLIDTMLQGYPMPKIYLRTTLDIQTRRSVRDVVDGQQRLRAILAFANDELVLTKKSPSFAGLRYRDLDDEQKEAFLSYPIGVEQLINATDDMVLETFSRLNSYTVPLNGAELRHARYQSDFKWHVRELSELLRGFWTRYHVLTTSEIVRMEDDELTAEFVGIVCRGVCPGGDSALNQLYQQYDHEFPDAMEVSSKVNAVIDWIESNLRPVLGLPELTRAPQFLMLFAAVAHQRFGIPSGKVKAMPPRTPLRPPREAVAQLELLAEAVRVGDYAEPFRDFVDAAKSRTVHMKSREVRFAVLTHALVVDDTA